MNKLDLFETLIKNSAEAHEMPLESSAWSQMNSKLDASSGGSGSAGGLNTIAACLSGLVIVGGLATLGSSLKNAPQENYTNNVTYVNMSQDNNAPVKHETTNLIVENSNTPSTPDVDSKNEALPANHISKMEQTSIDVYDPQTKETTVVEIDKLKDQLSHNENQGTNGSIDHKYPELDLYIEEFKNDESAQTERKELQNIIPLPGNATPCEGQKVEFDILMYNEHQTTEWDFGDGYISSSRNPAHTYEKAGVYTVTLKTRSKENSNEVLEKTTKIKVLATPDVDFEVYTSDYAARPMTSLESKNSGNAAVWSISNGEKYSGSKAETIFNKKGSKTITLTEVASNGCEASKTETIYIENDYNLLAPNAFTPDGNGTNEGWFPVALTDLNFSYDLVIFDKAGKTVYTTRSNRPWNGINNKTGENCPSGFYVWYVKLTNDKNQIEEYKGSFQLFGN